VAADNSQMRKRRKPEKGVLKTKKEDKRLVVSESKERRRRETRMLTQSYQLSNLFQNADCVY